MIASWPEDVYQSTTAWSLPQALAQSDLVRYDYLISAVCLQNSQGCLHIPASSLNGFFDQAALYFGNRLQGVRSAWHKGMKQNKFIPLFISLQPLLVFLPDQAARSDTLCFLNFCRIEKIEPDPCKKSRSIITFCDGLQISSPSHTQMERNFLRTKWYLAKIYSSQSSQ